MTKMVYDAIEKYIHPSRYRQIVETESVKNLTKEEQDVGSKNQKHSSVVARVHYQKEHSRDIAKKGQECMKKLQGVQGEQLEEYIQSKLCALNESCPEDVTMPLTNDTPLAPSETITSSQQNNCSDKTNKPKEIRSVRKPQSKKLLFTSEEDENLKQALLHYGNGQWTAMLKDKRFKFQCGRKADSLKKRAESKFPKLCRQ